MGRERVLINAIWKSESVESSPGIPGRIIGRELVDLVPVSGNVIVNEAHDAAHSAAPRLRNIVSDENPKRSPARAA
jgi:hypothetical protein